MPYLWSEASGGDLGWLAHSLTGTLNLKEGEPGRELVRDMGEDADVWLLPAHEGAPGTRRWILLWQAGADVRVNGGRQDLGVRVLADRDELIVGGVRRYFFSSESLPVATRLPRNARGVRCQLCCRLIEAGERVVRCPSCGAWHHLRDDLACWTYAESCSHCHHSTEMKQLSWSPEGL